MARPRETEPHAFALFPGIHVRDDAGRGSARASAASNTARDPVRFADDRPAAVDREAQDLLALEPRAVDGALQRDAGVGEAGYPDVDRVRPERPR